LFPDLRLPGHAVYAPTYPTLSRPTVLQALQKPPVALPGSLPHLLPTPPASEVFSVPPQSRCSDIVELYPRESAATRFPVTVGQLVSPLPTVNNSVGRVAREAFVTTMLSPRVQALLNQKFGKENLNQCFAAEACFRHVLLPLWKSGFLEDDEQAWNALSGASAEARTLLDLLREYGDVDFNALQGYPANWNTEAKLNKTRVRSTSAYRYELPPVTSVVEKRTDVHFLLPCDDMLTYVGMTRGVQEDLKNENFATKTLTLKEAEYISL
jgi:hypothetical protein